MLCTDFNVVFMPCFLYLLLKLFLDKILIRSYIAGVFYCFKCDQCQELSRVFARGA